MTAQITSFGLIDMQVCVPEDWNDIQILEFAEKENPCGTTHGWLIRSEGNRLLAGDLERIPCKDRSRHCHIMLDA